MQLKYLFGPALASAVPAFKKGYHPDIVKTQNIRNYGHQIGVDYNRRFVDTFVVDAVVARTLNEPLRVEETVVAIHSIDVVDFAGDSKATHDRCL